MLPLDKQVQEGWFGKKESQENKGMAVCGGGDRNGFGGWLWK